MQLGRIPRGVDRQFRLARMWSNRELNRFASQFQGDVVNVSAGEDVDKEGNHYRDYFSSCDGYYTTNHAPGSYRGFGGRENETLLDLCEDLPSDLEERFDVVFNHTTLEHVPRPEKAMQNLCRLSRDVVVIVVPFLQVQHETDSYQDYWRFTPRALSHYFKENQFSVVYQAANNHPNASIYVMQVASRFPDRWQSTFHAAKPKEDESEPLGQWLGADPVHRFPRSVIEKFRSRKNSK